MYDVAVIGAGAAGYAAAIQAAGLGAAAVLIEAHDRPGRKLMATGNGRCNILNAGALRYLCGSEFARFVLEAADADRVRAFFDSIGLPLTQPLADGRVYPCADKASCVLDTLRLAAEKLNVHTMLNACVSRIEKLDDAFLLTLPDKTVRARKVILACGSPAGGALGRDSLGLLTGLNVSTRPFTPVLCPILCDMRPYRALRGMRFFAQLRLVRNGKVLDMAGGELLVNDTNLSGICAMQLSAACRPADRIEADLRPHMGLVPRVQFHGLQAPEDGEKAVREVTAFLRHREALLGKDDVLTGLFQASFVRAVKAKCETPEHLARFLTAMPFEVVGTRGMDSAQAARGGALTGSFDPRTMECCACPGLYCAGEMLDVDGDCGGFNLLFAWSSGLTAGKSAALSARSERKVI